MASPLLRLGTRGSPLALAQAHELRRRLAEAHPELAAPDAVAIAVIRTTGDRVTSRPLADIGGKGLFTKEIEEALLAGDIDIAVHSMKDMPSFLPAGLAIACHLPREDPRDALISARGIGSIAALPHGAVIGTSSLRRKAQLLHRRPDLVIVPLRGNVGTRLQKLADGAADATLLAVAGLKRLGQEAHIAAALAPEEMLPAVAQGAIAIETRSADGRVQNFLAPLDHAETAICVGAERALLAVLDGSCRTPIAALARLTGQHLVLDAQVIRPDGSEVLETRREGPANAAAQLGADAGAELKSRAGPGFFAETA